MIVSEINIKIVILGYWGVGKTSTVNSFTDKEVPKIYIPTIGSHIARKEYKLKDAHVRVNIWDIGGQRSFNPLNSVYFTNLDAALLMFDLSNPKESLIELQRTYMSNLKKYSSDCITFLTGNKSDLIKPEDSEVLINNVRQNIKETLPLLFISAKNQSNSTEAFELIIFNFLKKLEKDATSTQFTGIAKEFLSLIDKTEEELTRLFINLDQINSSTLQKKITPKIRRKVVNDIDERVNKKMEALTELEISPSLNIDLMKLEIINTYANNLNLVRDSVDHLRRIPIDILIPEIDKTLVELSQLKDDFKLKLDSIMEINNNKSSVQNPKIQSKRIKEGE